jgi:signal transduction histidine kinase
MTKVILVSHRAALLRGLAAGVFGEGVEIEVASDLKTLLRGNTLDAPQLIIVDAPALRDGDLSAIEAMRAARPESRLLLIFSLEQRPLASRALILGFDAYLLEPFTLDEFAASAKRLLSRVTESSEQSASERMDVLSIFLRGLAHEILNPLTTVSGILQLLMHPGPVEESKDEIQKRYAIMLEATQRIGTILKELEFFVRVRRPERGLVQLTELVTDLGARLRQSAPPVVVHIGDLPPSLPRILVDRDQIVFAFANLARYAAKVSAGETVRLSLRRFDRGRVEVQVTGKGKPSFPQDLDRIFVPFYSRTGRDFAEGLSLSAAYGIVRSHQGTVRVEAIGTEGFRFSVLLPTGESDVKQD